MTRAAVAMSSFIIVSLSHVEFFTDYMDRDTMNFGLLKIVKKEMANEMQKKVSPRIMRLEIELNGFRFMCIVHIHHMSKSTKSYYC